VALIHLVAVGTFAQQYTFQHYEQEEGLKNHDGFVSVGNTTNATPPHPKAASLKPSKRRTLAIYHSLRTGMREAKLDEVIFGRL
jgi:hypothetical protein